MKHEFERYCKDYENIENYEKAKKDNFKSWHCHHRLETHTPDGKRREVDIPHKKLKALGMYYNRPASELIFLTSREHNAFNKGKLKGNKNRLGKKHSEESKKKNAEAHKGKKHTDETRRKIAEATKGENNPMYGKTHSEEAREKMREAKKGNKNVRGTRWYNNGKINVRAKQCPDGFTPGRIKKP